MTTHPTRPPSPTRSDALPTLWRLADAQPREREAEMNTDALAAWLRAQGYREASVLKAVSDLRSYIAQPDLATNPSSEQRQRDYRRAWDFALAFLALTEKATDEILSAKLGVPAPPRVFAKPRTGPRLLRRKRQMPAISHADAEWKVLRAAIKADKTVAARVLEVCADTGLRIGDVLRVEQKELRSGMTRADGVFTIIVKGGKPVFTSVETAPEAWQRLLGAMKDASHAARAVSHDCDPHAPSSHSPAYKACDRKLKHLAEACGTTGRAHMHRFRRTVVVRMIKRGVSLETVAKIVHHSSSRTTAGYGDEAMPGIGAAALRQIREED
jgi:integrase